MSTLRIPLDPGYGFAEFEVGGTVTKPIDLAAAADAYRTLLKEHSDADGQLTNPHGFDLAWTARLKEWGFPVESLSTEARYKVVGLLHDALGGLRKKDPPPDSSTGPG